MESAEKKVVVRVHCPSHNRLAELNFPEGDKPLPRHFECGQGICYVAGVVCNFGGKPCTGFPEAVKESVKYLS